MTAKEKATKLINEWIAKGEITTRPSKVTDIPVVYIKHEKTVYFIEELQNVVKTEFSFLNGIIFIYLEEGLKMAIIPQ